MNLISASSSLIGNNYWLELPDGRAIRYDLRSLSLSPQHLQRHSFGIAKEQIGVQQTNPDYVTLNYCQPPKIEASSFRDECFLHAKQDALLNNIVSPEFVEAFVEAMTP